MLRAGSLAVSSSHVCMPICVAQLAGVFFNLSFSPSVVPACFGGCFYFEIGFLLCIKKKPNTNRRRCNRSFILRHGAVGLTEKRVYR